MSATRRPCASKPSVPKSPLEGSNEFEMISPVARSTRQLPPPVPVGDQRFPAIRLPGQNLNPHQGRKEVTMVFGSAWEACIAPTALVIERASPAVAESVASDTGARVGGGAGSAGFGAGAGAWALGAGSVSVVDLQPASSSPAASEWDPTVVGDAHDESPLFRCPDEAGPASGNNFSQRGGSQKRYSAQSFPSHPETNFSSGRCQRAAGSGSAA